MKNSIFSFMFLVWAIVECNGLSCKVQAARFETEKSCEWVKKKLQKDSVVELKCVEM